MTTEAALKAAETRRLNKLGQSAPGSQERGAGIEPELWIAQDAERLVVSIRFVHEGKPAEGLPTSDLALRDLRWVASVNPGDEDASGFASARYAPHAELLPDLIMLEMVTPIMRRLDRFLAQVVETSEDASFAKAVDSLASHLRVSRIVHECEGKQTSAKRGAAYITAHKIAEAFVGAVLARRTEPEKGTRKAA